VAHIVPLPEPALEPDNLPTRDSSDREIRIFQEQKETGEAPLVAEPCHPEAPRPVTLDVDATDGVCGTWAPLPPATDAQDPPAWMATVHPFRAPHHEPAAGQRHVFVPLWLSGLGRPTQVGSMG
jgi:hypothetical protein